MAAVQGPFHNTDDPREAVAAACARQGVEPDHVEVAPLHITGARAWQWQLAAEAPEVVLLNVFVFDVKPDRQGRQRPTGRVHRPRLAAGVVIAHKDGFIVVADDEGGVNAEDLITAGLETAHGTSPARRTR